MKKTLLSLMFSIACLCSWAQDISLFTCDSEKECVRVADSLLRDSKRKYKLVKTSYEQSAYKYYNLDFQEVGNISSPLKLTVIFKQRMRGANPSLEIIGTPCYELITIKGKYLDIFPIWKKYIDPNADIDKVSTSSRQSKNINESTIYEFVPQHGYNGFWTIHSVF